MENFIKTLTLVVPAYNCAGFINNLFDHIPFEQLDNELEVIIVDDGSTDNTWEVLKEIQEKYGTNNIRIYKKENGNWGSVHNYAKKLPINGRFVKTLDSDDYLDPYALIKFISFLDKLPPDIDIVFSNVNFINKEDKIVSQKFYDKLFKAPFFKIDDLKITKLSVLTIHTFTFRREIYQNLPDLPVKMAYMDSVMIFLLINASLQKNAFFSFSPLYQYQSGNEEQTISVQNFSKHSDWLAIMLETQAHYAIDHNIFEHNSVGKNKILGQMMELGFFLYAFAVSFKNGLTNKEKSTLIYNEILVMQKILGKHYFKKYFYSFSIRFLKAVRCKLFPSFLRIIVMVLNTGYLKATKKDGKRKSLGWNLFKNNKPKVK